MDLQDKEPQRYDESRSQILQFNRVGEGQSLWLIYPLRQVPKIL